MSDRHAAARHLAVLSRGVEAWNAWRRAEPRTRPDLREAVLPNARLAGADLHDVDLYAAVLEGADLRGANLTSALLKRANLSRASLRAAGLRSSNLSMANLTAANLMEADFTDATLVKACLRECNIQAAEFIDARLDHVDLRGATGYAHTFTRATLRDAMMRGLDLTRANLRDADLTRADLSGAVLRNADLVGSRLVEADLADADLEGSRVYGISAWNVKLSAGTKQSGLLLSHHNEPAIVADSLAMAQFLHCLLDNRNVRSAFDELTRRLVLLLGRFTPRQKLVLDAIRERLRLDGWIPVIFDFEIPERRSILETILVLAGMAVFVMVDLTSVEGSGWVQAELEAIRNGYSSVPIVPLLRRDDATSAWAARILGGISGPSLLDPTEYDDWEGLRARLPDVMRRAAARAQDLRRGASGLLP